MKFLKDKFLVKYYLYTFIRSVEFLSAVLVPFFTDFGNLSQFQIQILQSWFALCLFLLEVPTGIVADKYSRKKSIIIGVILLGIGSLVYGGIPNFYIFLFAEFILAAGLAFISGADKAFLYDYLASKKKESEYGKHVGRTYSMKMSGLILGIPIGSYLATHISLNAPMYLNFIPNLIALVLLLNMKDVAIYKKTTESKKYTKILKDGWKQFAHNIKIRFLAIDMILISMIAYFSIWLYQPVLKSIGIDIKYFGLFHILLLVFEIIIGMLFGKIEKVLHKKYFIISAVLVGIGFFQIAFFQNIYSVILLLFLVGGIGLTREQYHMIYINKYITGDNRATISSFVMMFKRLAIAILNPFIGYLFDVSMMWTFLILGSISFISISLYIRYNRVLEI